MEVDDRLFEAAVDAAAAFRACSGKLRPLVEVVEPVPLPVGWLPQLRSPDALFDAYSGSQGSLTAAARETAEQDLRILALPGGLERRVFEQAVAVKLLQVPLIAGVDRLVARPRRFGEVRDYLARRAEG